MENTGSTGELLNTYGYGLSGGEKSLKCLNYYDNTEITIPLDPTMTAQENAKRYFDKYNKQKRTYEAVTEQLAQTKAEIDHLESISTSMDIARLEEDLVQIKEGNTEYGCQTPLCHPEKGKDRKPPVLAPATDSMSMSGKASTTRNEEPRLQVGSGDW